MSTPPLRALALELLDLFAPRACAACDALHPARPPLCDVCREALVPPDDVPEHVSAAFAHGGPLARAVYRAKYDGDPARAVALGALLCEEAHLLEGRVDLVVPVALHPARLRARGYNQSHELARTLARRLGARLSPDLVARVRDTPTQTRLDRDARRRNVEGAFAAVDARALAGRDVLVVDDVCTTGATLAAMRAAVLGAGARSARSVTLAAAALSARS